MLYLKVWDVQFGSATYIKTPNGKHIVQDLGIGSFKTNMASFSPLLFLKDRMRVKRLDEVIITHPHADHIRDIYNFDILDPEAINKPEPLIKAEIIADNRAEDASLVDKYSEISKRYGEPVSMSVSPLKTNNNGGANIRVFSTTKCDRSNINNQSTVTVISYATSKIVLPGDNEEESWQELLQQTDFVEAIEGTDIFLAAHHGMEKGYYADLFNHIHPKLVIISNGRFTSSDCVERYSKLASGWNVKRKNGDILEKKCLATNDDGNIEIAMGWISQGKKSYLSVITE